MAPRQANATAKPLCTLLCIDKRVLAEGSRAPLSWDAPVRTVKQLSRRCRSWQNFPEGPLEELAHVSTQGPFCPHNSTRTRTPSGYASIEG